MDTAIGISDPAPSVEARLIDAALVEHVMARLTPRERRITRLVADGAKPDEIAVRLDTTPGSVRTELCALRRKAKRIRARLDSRAMKGFSRRRIDIDVKDTDPRQLHPDAEAEIDTTYEALASRPKPTRPTNSSAPTPSTSPRAALSSRRRA
jgi:DNA-binding CsgD family transcriptional regulator